MNDDRQWMRTFRLRNPQLTELQRIVAVRVLHRSRGHGRCCKIEWASILGSDGCGTNECDEREQECFHDAITSLGGFRETVTEGEAVSVQIADRVVAEIP